MNGNVRVFGQLLRQLKNLFEKGKAIMEEKKYKTVNLLGDTQREQWHSVVNMLRQLGGDMTREGRSGLCDEIDRYIDYVEDILDELRKKGE